MAPSTTRIAIGLVAAGILYRVLYLAELSRLPEWTHLRADELYYFEAARDLSGGVCKPFHLSPLFITLLALLRRLAADGPLGFRVLLAALGVGSSLLLFGIARRHLGDRAGLAALALYLFCGPLLFYESNLDVATVASTCALAALYAAQRFFDGGRVGWWIVAGIAVGLGITARPNAALLVPVLAFAPLVMRRQFSTARRLALAALPSVALLVTLPVTIYNHRCSGELVWISDTGGINFYVGNHRAANGTFNAPPRLPSARSVWLQERAFARVAERDLGHSLTRAEVGAYWRDQTLREIAADPSHWLRLMAKKLLLVLHDDDIANTRSYPFRCEILPAQGPWLVQVGYLTPLAVVGILLWLRRPRERFLPLGFTLAYVAALTLLFVLGHYRQVLVPLFILAAVSSVTEMVGLYRDGRRGVLIGLLFVVALLAVLVHWPRSDAAPDLERSGEAFRHGLALEEQGDLVAAEHWYFEALTPKPDEPIVLRALALLFQRTGREERAAPLWRRLAELARASGDRLQAEEAERFLGAAPAQ